MIDVRRLVAPARSSDRSPRGRVLAVLGSLAAHLAIFLAAFSAASGGVVSASGSAGGPPGPVFNVTLVSLPSGASTAPGGAPNVLSAKLVSSSQDPVFGGSGLTSLGLQSLFETLRNQQIRTPSPQPPLPRSADVQTASAGSPDASSSNSPRPRSNARSDADGEAAGGESTGALWGAIEPCWRNLGARGRVPVVLEIALNSRGDLRSPPRIVRDPAAILSEPRLQSEATALAAVAACAPKGDLRFSNRIFRVEFPGTP